MERKRVKKTLVFELNEKDKLKRGAMLASIHANVQQLESELFGLKKEYRIKIQDHNEKLRFLVDAIVTGKEERELHVEEVPNYDEKIMNYLYRGQVVGSRAMTEAEAQMDFGEVIREPEKEKVNMIACLGCGDSFESQHKHNKRCPNCKKTEDYRFAKEA